MKTVVSVFKQTFLMCVLGGGLVGCNNMQSVLKWPIIPGGIPLTTSTFFTGSAYEEKYRTASVVQEPSIFTTNISGQNIVHVAYSSDEYCGENDCGVKNIAYRNSLDNFKTRIDVTQNTSGDAMSPKMVVKTNGTIMIVYSSKEFNSTIYNLAYRTMAIGGSSFSARSNITTSTQHDVNNPSLGITTTDVVHLAYETQEYCDLNACNYRSVGLRSNADNFAARTDLGTDMVCHASHPFLVVQGGGSNVIHLLWNLQSNGACAGGHVFRYAKSSNAYASPSLINRIYFGAAFTVKNDGTAFIHYISIWPSVAVTCSGWQILSSSSADNFATETSLQGSCITQSSPGYQFSPSLFVDASDVVHILYISAEVTGPYNTLSYRNSLDGFTAKTVIETSSFTPFSYPLLTIDSAGTKWAFAVTASSSSAGLNAYKSTNFSARIPVSKSTFGEYGITRDNDGNFWLATLSLSYCSTHNCNQFNIEARSLQTGAKQDVTKFTSGSLQITTPRIIQYPAAFGAHQEIYYNSNEANPDWLNFAKRDSADAFATVNYISNSSTGANVLSSRADLTLDKNLTLLFPILDGANAWFSMLDSANWVQTRVSGQTGTFATALAGYVTTNKNTGEIAAAYYGNEGGSWGPKIRSQANLANFSAMTNSASGGFSFSFNPVDDDLYMAFISSQALSGIYNVSIRKRSDNYATRQDPFLVFDSNSIGGCVNKWNIFYKIDEKGVQHLVYSSREQNADVCNVAYRNSLDWSKRRDISSQQNIEAGPVNLFLKSDTSSSVVCYATSYKLSCQELPR